MVKFSLGIGLLLMMLFVMACSTSTEAGTGVPVAVPVSEPASAPVAVPALRSTPMVAPDAMATPESTCPEPSDVIEKAINGIIGDKKIEITSQLTEVFDNETGVYTFSGVAQVTTGPITLNVPFTIKYDSQTCSIVVDGF